MKTFALLFGIVSVLAGIGIAVFAPSIFVLKLVSYIYYIGIGFSLYGIIVSISPHAVKRFPAFFVHPLVGLYMIFFPFVLTFVVAALIMSFVAPATAHASEVSKGVAYLLPLVVFYLFAARRGT